MNWFHVLQAQTQAALISAVISAAVALLLALVNPFTQRQLERAKSRYQREWTPISRLRAAFWCPATSIRVGLRLDFKPVTSSST